MKANKRIYERFFKRIFDFVVSVIALAVLFPFLLVIAVLIKLDSSGSIFYMQKRPGKNLKIFEVYKFRTMRTGADRFQQVGVEVMKNDNRKIGRASCRERV